MGINWVLFCIAEGEALELAKRALQFKPNVLHSVQRALVQCAPQYRFSLVIAADSGL